MMQKMLFVTGFNSFQRALHFFVKVIQYLQGIGTGSTVGTSGERAVLVRLAAKRKGKFCVFDVGANKGQFAIEVLSVLGGRADLHCFEPSPATFKILEGGLQTSSNVHLNNEALGKETGNAKLYSNEIGSGLASLTRRNLDHFGVDFSMAEDVIVSTVDTYCVAHGIDHIDLLKIDVEGHELDVLIGAKSMFMSDAIDCVTFEFGGCNIDTRTFFRDFFYFFTERNMAVFRITPSGYLMRIEKYSEICEQFRTTNFIAVRQ